jgi:hypothetical protein
LQLHAIISANTVPIDHFMGFQLSRMHMPVDLFSRRDAHKVVAKPAVRVLGSDEVLEFHPFKDGVPGPGDAGKIPFAGGKAQTPVYKSFASLIHDLSPFSVFYCFC